VQLYSEEMIKWRGACLLEPTVRRSLMMYQL